MKKVHQYRQTRRLPQASLRRVPADFGWTLCGLLLKELSPCLPSDFVSDYQTALRERNGNRYIELQGIYTPQRIAYECGHTNPEVEPSGAMLTSIVSCYLITKLLAKYESLGCTTMSERRRKAFDLFTEIESRPRPKACWCTDDPVVHRQRQILSRMLGPAPTMEMIADASRHGPGSTAGTLYSQRSTYFKYKHWPYAVSRGCYGLFRSVITTDERWLGSLEQDYRRRNDIPAWAILDWKQFWSNIITFRESNVVTTVPKDGTKNRLIAKEPVGNMYIQLGVGSIMKARMRPWIDLTDQRTNQRLARLGSRSINNSQMPCTVDLSNASDTVNRDLVQTLLPSDWFALLDCIRSEWGELPTASWRYAKMSSMGNATTFELESAIFSSLIFACIELYGDPEIDYQYTSVFGDDLVFPQYLYQTVVTYLEDYGFEVNSKKSFRVPPFMESCGHDYYAGHNIRPVFLKDEVASLPQLLSIRNRLNRWFALNIGTLMPLGIDCFFSKYIENLGRLPNGPESDDEFDTYWHTHLGRRYDVKFESLTPIMPKIPGKDLWFRKLMHDLRSHSDYESAGSRFNITDSTAGWRISRRSLCVRTYYLNIDGSEQDHDRPPFEELEWSR